MNLEITPYVGASPLNFGITEADAIEILGVPSSRAKNSFPPGFVLDYCGAALAFDTKGRLTQMGFDKHFCGALTYSNINLFQDDDALRKLLQLDHEVYLWVGFVMLMGLGIRLGGFHEPADEGRTVSIFERGRYDTKIARFQAFPQFPK